MKALGWTLSPPGAPKTCSAADGSCELVGGRGEILESFFFFGGGECFFFFSLVVFVVSVSVF